MVNVELTVLMVRNPENMPEILLPVTSYPVYAMHDLITPKSNITLMLYSTI